MDSVNRRALVQIASLSNVTAIAAGASHSLALESDGTVWAWGQNSGGQVGDGTTTARATPVQVSGLEGVTAIGAGHTHSFALKADGTVWVWGYQLASEGWYLVSHKTPVQVTGLGGIVAVAGGSQHDLALRSDGALFTWGANGQGRRLRSRPSNGLKLVSRLALESARPSAPSASSESEWGP